MNNIIAALRGSEVVGFIDAMIESGYEVHIYPKRGVTFKVVAGKDIFIGDGATLVKAYENFKTRVLKEQLRV